MVLDLTSGRTLKTEVAEQLLAALEAWGQPKHAANAANAVATATAPDGSPLAGDAAANADANVDADADALSEAFRLPGGAPLLSSVALPALGGDAAQGDLSAQREEQAAAADARTRELLNENLGATLKQAVNMSCCTPALWGLLGRWYGLQ
eukprot:275067-Chlamydomonas_euryale.AAC.1